MRLRISLATELAMASIGFSACVEPSRYGDTPEYENAKLPTSPYLSNRACHGAGDGINRILSMSLS